MFRAHLLIRMYDLSRTREYVQYVGGSLSLSRFHRLRKVIPHDRIASLSRLG